MLIFFRASARGAPINTLPHLHFPRLAKTRFDYSTTYCGLRRRYYFLDWQGSNSGDAGFITVGDAIRALNLMQDVRKEECPAHCLVIIGQAHMGWGWTTGDHLENVEVNRQSDSQHKNLRLPIGVG